MSTEKQKESLSVIIITKNEEENIRRALESVKWADEIVIFDSGSSDHTCAICREYTSLVYETDWPGYGPQKRRAMAKATKEWVLSIDADEYVTEELRKEIKQAIRVKEIAAYRIPRLEVFYDQVIKYANSSCLHLCLCQRKRGDFSDSQVHERLIVDGDIGQLKSPLYHYSFKNIDAILSKLNYYSSLSAKMRHKSGKKGGILKALFHKLWMFFRVYFLQLGFLDGRAGFVLAMTFAEGSYYRYVKLMYLEKERQMKKEAK